MLPVFLSSECVSVFFGGGLMWQLTVNWSRWLDCLEQQRSYVTLSFFTDGVEVAIAK